MVVLIHGWCLDGWANFHQAYEALADAGWRVIVPDLPGHGQSPCEGRWSLESFAEAVVELMDFLAVGRAVLVGYSMGGPVSQLIARDHPERVVGLVQVATAAHVAPAVARPTPRWALLALRAGGHVGDLVASRIVGPLWSGVASHGQLEAFAAAGAELLTFDARGWVGDLTCDVICVVTERDHVVSRSAQLELAELTNGTVLCVGHGHLEFLQHGFGTVLVEALDSLPAKNR